MVILAILLVAFGPSQDWGSILSLTLMLYGLWVIALAGIRAKSPVTYERGALSTLYMGILLVTVGGAWFLYAISPIYAMALLILVIGILAVAYSLLRTRKVT
jgi:hypothetical protein